MQNEAPTSTSGGGSLEMSYGVNLFEILVCEVFFLIDKKYLTYSLRSLLPLRWEMNRRLQSIFLTISGFQYIISIIY